MKKKILFIIVLCIISFSCFAQGLLKDKYPVLKICSEAGYIPFDMIDAQGKWYGFDIDIITQFAKKENIPIKINNIRLDGLIPSILTDKCNISTALSVTVDREKIISFSEPIFINSIAAAFIDNDKNRKAFKTFEDLDKKGIILGSQTSSSATAYLSKHLKKATVLQFNTQNDEMQALQLDKVQAVVEDNTFLFVARKKMEKDIFIVESSQKQGLAFGLNKRDVELLGALNRFLIEFKKSSEYKKLVDSYF